MEVLAEDQERINQFSRLNQRYDEIGSELEELDKQVEDLEEMETELELLDEDETVMCGHGTPQLPRGTRWDRWLTGVAGTRLTRRSST